MLDKYCNVKSDNIPKRLPSHKRIYHEMELLVGTKPSVKNAYHMAPPELCEL